MRAATHTLRWLLVSASIGCGGRTALFIGPTDAGVDAPADATVDAAPDAIADVVGRPCETDAQCGNGDYCTSASCDPEQGCVLTPRDCNDGVACTNDTCDEAKKRCDHTPDDALCPDTELCSETRGCAAFVYAVASDGHLYEVDVPSAQLHDLGMSPASASDIALTPDGTLYSTDSYVLYTSDRGNATTTAVGSILPLHMYNGLGSEPDGTLQATADVATVFSVDTMTAAATPLAPLPGGYRASGDLTFAGDQLFVTLTSSTEQSTDSLAIVDAASQSTSIVGDTGYTCIWGLATLGGTMYGLTCTGQLLSIDPSNGQSQLLGQAQPAFFGAAGR
jgi:hypothetical protein